jgi:bile-acid 7alpha-dehydratase
MELTPQLLVEIEKIKRVKYAYLRTLDLKQWADLAEGLTDDVTSSYSDGKHSFSGKAEVMGFLKEAMDDPKIITKHHCHHPEIEFISATEAKATWYLTDLVINPGNSSAEPPIQAITLEGTGFYEDRYRKEKGVWKICHTGYQRVYREIFDRKNMAVLHLKSRFTK